MYWSHRGECRWSLLRSHVLLEMIGLDGTGPRPIRANAYCCFDRQLYIFYNVHMHIDRDQKEKVSVSRDISIVTSEKEHKLRSLICRTYTIGAQSSMGRLERRQKRDVEQTQ